MKLELHPQAPADAGRSTLCSGRRIPLRRRERLRRLQGARAGRRSAGHRRPCGRRSASERSATAGAWPAARPRRDAWWSRWSSGRSRVLTDEARRAGRAARGAGRGDRPGHHDAGGPGGGSGERRSPARGDRAQPAGALRRRRDEPPAIRSATSRANWAASSAKRSGGCWAASRCARCWWRATRRCTISSAASMWSR